MQAFFSGTDFSELHDSTPFHNYYLSLIVNYAGEYVAKVAYIAKKITTVEYKNASDVPQKSTTEKEILAMIDMDIHWEVPEVTITDFFRTRFDKIKQEKEKKVPINRLPNNSRSTFIMGGPTQVSGSHQSYNWNEWEREYDDSHYPPTLKGQGKPVITKEGNLQQGSKELRPLSLVEDEIRATLKLWLQEGATVLTTDMPISNDIPGLLNYFKDFFDQPENEGDYPFFLNQMQRNMETMFAKWPAKLVSLVGSKLLDTYDPDSENDVATDFYGAFDSFEQYMSTIEDMRMDVPFEVEEVKESPFEQVYNKSKGKNNNKSKGWKK